MIAKLLMILSIFFNTFGMSAKSLDLDKQILSSRSGTELTASASFNSAIGLPEIKVPPRVNVNSIDPNIYARNYLLLDSESNTYLSMQKENEKVPIASTTKIMTAIIVLENYKLDDIVTISSEAARQVGLDYTTTTKEQLTVGDLLKVLLIISSNRAAYALAEHLNTDGETGVEKFVGLMNAKALTLGMDSTEYHDPAGLDTTGWSTASDLAIVTKYALRDPVFAEIVKTPQTTVSSVSGRINHDLKNSNRLVAEWNYSGILGVKTGYMPEASHCLVAAAKRDGHTLIAIILYTLNDTASASAEEARKLLDWGWKNVSWGS
jgi:D-alanyl-D-alanine carboxypeptidase (penicillin-binding protein 5/6)